MDPFFLHEEPDKEGGKSSAEEKKKGKKEKKQTAKGKRKQKEQEEKQQAAVEDEEEDEVQEEAHEGENEEDEGEGDEKQAKPGRKSRKNKPIEMSSKVPVSRFRQIVPPSRPKPRDPRFEETAGPYSEHIFKATCAPGAARVPGPNRGSQRVFLCVQTSFWRSRRSRKRLS